MTIFLDGQQVQGLVDTEADDTILTEIEALRFPHWKFKPGPPISGVRASWTHELPSSQFNGKT